MSILRLLRRSLVHHARAHLGALLGAAVAAAVLVGALIVGDSVRGSLRDLALLRLGRVSHAISTGDRLFTSLLPLSLQAALNQSGLLRAGQPGLAPVLQLPGVAVNADATARANQVQVLGVDQRFWALAPGSAPLGDLADDVVLLNAPLASQLRAQPGDTVLLRVRKPQALSADAPLAPEEDATVALRLRVQAVLGDAQFGRFGLEASQVAPFSAFVSLPELQRRSGATNRANLLLVPETAATPFPQATAAGGTVLLSGVVPPDLEPHLDRVLTQRWQLADAQLEWHQVPASGLFELRSSRVFLDAAVHDALFGGPGVTNPIADRLQRDLPGLEATGVLTYFVNELRVGDRATPYSMVTATGAPLAPADLRDDEILITEWLANDLQAKPGDELTLKYFVVGPLRRLEERAATFRVRSILPMTTRGLDPELMPDFPGLTDAENCRDWDTGLPVDSGRIRPEDEAYWDQYRGTPKAVITLAAGQKLWESRFGNLTAIRFQPRAGLAVNPATVSRSLAAYQNTLGTLLQRQLDPAAFGLRFQPVRAQALAASAGGQDFGQLFLGFSFFLIAAALLLLAVLFQFGIERRAAELGTLLAMGFRPWQAGRLLLLEGGLVALAGCLLGAWGGVAYARAMLDGLSTVWSEAVGGAVLTYHARPTTLAIGIAAAAIAAWLTMALALRRHLRQPARQLLAEGAIEPTPTATGWRRPAVVALATGVLAAGMAAAGAVRGEQANPALFFGAGALLLLCGLSATSAWLRRLASSPTRAALSLEGLGVRSATRARRRSLAVVGLLACGAFLVGSIGVFRLDAVRNAGQRSSGTGGFALIAEATQPVIHDLDTAAGRDAYGLSTNTLAGTAVVPFRVRDGDDASCLNLNRTRTPRLLGVAPALLATRQAFTFAAVPKGPPATDAWLALKRTASTPVDEVPAIGDAASIQWALGLKVGDTLDYADERGRVFKIRIVGAVANSILQGSLVIDEDEFVRRFPSAAGYRYLLVDAPPEAAGSVAAELTRGLRDLGVEVTSTVTRLNAFNAVQNTYLGTFQVLGGLGLLLGSVGLGTVVLRNVLERRGELALLLAVGFRRGALRRMVFSEHAALLAAGLGIGLLAAATAVLPGVLTAGNPLPRLSLLATLLGILLNGLAWTLLATEVALRGRLLAALRNP